VGQGQRRIKGLEEGEGRFLSALSLFSHAPLSLFLFKISKRGKDFPYALPPLYPLAIPSAFSNSHLGKYEIVMMKLGTQSGTFPHGGDFR
jgi:hypothetical protein